jgi:low affinity Fe/Cu permease
MMKELELESEMLVYVVYMGSVIQFSESPPTVPFSREWTISRN